MKKKIIVILFCFLLTACRNDPATQNQPTQTPESINEPTPTVKSPETTAEAGVNSGDENFITVAADAPYSFFVEIDDFGNLTGFDVDVLQQIAEKAGLDFEFIVTPFAGTLESVANGEFDTAMSGLLIPETPIPGLVYSQPYLEVGQLIMIRANEDRFTTYQDITSAYRVGTQLGSNGVVAAEDVLGISNQDLLLYETPGTALQALIDRGLDAVIMDSDDAVFYTTEHFQQLKILGGEGQNSWVTVNQYGIAVNAGNSPLLERLNKAITELKNEGTLARLIDEQLVSKENIVAGDSLIGTAANEFVIGVSQTLTELDPASLPEFVSWEVKLNIASGLYRYDENGGLQPALFADVFISDDNLRYTFRLHDDLKFSDGSPLTAEDVRFSVMRSAGLGNWLINEFLKDADEDGFADGDSVQVLDPFSIAFDLKSPIAYFPSLLATPPYAIISQNCFQAGLDLTTDCGNTGPYVVDEWLPNERLQLRVNEHWVGEMPAFAKIQLRFYPSDHELNDALSRGAVDVAWAGLSANDLQTLSNNNSYRLWRGPAAFKSSLIFDHNQAPWNNELVRRAAALSLNRQLLADNAFGGLRDPLYSPIPDNVPGHVTTVSAPNLDEVESLLQVAGYTAENPVQATIWYVSDGRYSDSEDLYAAGIQEQLNATNLFSITVEGAPWDVFRNQKAACNYGAFLQGWPTPGQPVPYRDAMSWLFYFVEGTDTVCSNYENAGMTLLIDELEAITPTSNTEVLAKYGEIQLQWQEDVPSIPLIQAPRIAVAQLNVSNLEIDTMGLLHYDRLRKGN